MSAARFRQLLEAGDVAGCMAFWGQQMDYRKAEIQMHLTRTMSKGVAFKHRAYSHRWLLERDLPSQLPDHLRPSAEQAPPRVVEAVGISVNFSADWLKPAKPILEKVMGAAVEDCFANGDRDPALVKSRMLEARAREEKALFGRFPGRS